MTIGSKEGITHMDNAWRVMESVPEAGRIWQKTLFGKEPEVRALRKSIFGDMGDEAVRFDVRSERFRDVGLGRLFSAGDNAAVYALKRAGLSTDQAMRMTLAGTPETPMGKAIVNTAAKGLRSPNWLTRFGMSAVAPFARVATVGAEQGLKRFPGVGHFANALGMEHAPLKTRTARQLLGGAGLGAGYMLEGTPGESKMGIDPRITQTMGTAAGAAFLPFQFGRELRDVAQRTPEEASLGSMTEMGLKAFGNTAKEFSPLGFSPLGALFRPQELPGRLIPAGVSDIAEAMDPAARRETGAEALQQAAKEGTQAAVMGTPGVGRLAGRLPWLREQLPEAFAPVDWKGDPLLSSSIALPGLGQAGGSAPGVLSGIINRSLLPAREQSLPPIANMENPQLAQLSRMGLEFNAPSPSVSLPGMAGRLMGKIPMDAQTTAQVQKMRGQGRQASVDMLSQLAPLLERLPEPYRSRMMQLLQSRVEQPINRIESAAARALALSRTPRV